MIQEMHLGIELTTAFYVTKKRKLLGFITLERSLENGTTILCKVNDKYNKKVEEIIKKMIKHTDMTGSVNLQFIVDKNENIFPFEVNCRVSGTNSIRSNFGFKDVEYILEENLFNKVPNRPKIVHGTAIRVLMDIIYPEQEVKEIIKKKSKRSFIF